MRFRLLVSFFLLCITLTAQDFPPVPDPPRLVNDFADLLAPQEQQRLEQKLAAYHDSTSTQIAVVTVNSLNGHDVAGYSFELAELWGIGQQGEDNGILILIAPTERKMFIATGYGVESYIPDAIAKRIVEGTLKPNFRSGNYFAGLDQATNLLIGLLSGHFSAKQLEDEQPAFPFLLLIIIFIIIIYFVSRGKGNGAYRTPGGHTYMGPIRRGPTWTDFSGGKGTFGGGGFGGFGGGSFGGGGAGGSW
ncbi:MAG: hypothetical protein DHS20C17_26700 [Cyclobacteriaceae bacterium]|nr:MAG: hypothetical protein DHS20C17_26700 [Cyclobacteriaceae bacterium]